MAVVVRERNMMTSPSVFGRKNAEDWKILQQILHGPKTGKISPKRRLSIGFEREADEPMKGPGQVLARVPGFGAQDAESDPKPQMFNRRRGAPGGSG